MGRVTRLFRRARLERELDAELRFHVEEDTARLMADGVPAVEARRRALAAFGGLEPAREYTRDARGLAWLEDLAADLRYAARMMRRSPGFTLAAGLSLAVAVGANAAIFSVMDALILRRLPVERPGELSFLNHAGYDDENLRYSHPAWLELQNASPAAGLAAMSSTARMQLMAGDAAELINGQLVTGNWFEVAGVRAAQGRLLTPADTEVLGGAPVAVLSHAFWTRRFGADPALVDTSIRLNGLPIAIAGVAAPGFSGLTVGDRVDVWLPVTLQHDIRYAGNASSSDDADDTRPWVPQANIDWLTLVLRSPGGADRALFASLAAVHARMAAQRAERIGNPERRAYELRDHLELIPGARGLSPLRESFTLPLRVLMATVGVVLLIACANLASLLLARGAARGREFALRLSLGARRGRIVRQLLTESVALASLGGLGAIALAQWGGHALLRLASSTSRPIPLDVHLDWRVLGFTVAVALLTGLAFGLVPALRLSRADLSESIKSGGRVIGVTRSASALPFGRVLVVSQVALSLTLLVGAILFLRTFLNLIGVDAGFERERVVSARFDLRLAGIDEGQLPALYDRLLEQARRVPGATLASLGANGPVAGTSRTSGFVIEGQPRRTGRDGAIREDFVGPDYFEMMGMPIVKGRDFSARDVATAPDVVIVNETMARKYFGDASPIGRHIGYDEPARMEIVGVVRDARVDGLRRAVPALVYHALAQHPDEYVRNLYVRVGGSPDLAKAALARAVSAAEPAVAVRETVTLAELAERTVSNERLISQLTGTFGVVAVLVACLGLYGTVSYSVVRRTSEIGVRLALGATPSQVRWLVLRETLILVAAGSVCGVILVAAAMRLAATLLYGLSPYDPATLAAAMLALTTMGLLASLLPAWRASRVEPTAALRAE